MDKLFVANIEDKEILNKFYADTEVIRDTPPDNDKNATKQPIATEK